MDEPTGRNEGWGGPRAPCPADIDAFASALAGLDSDVSIYRLIEGGSPSWLRRHVFGPAARRLGDWWVEDRICFATVTLGMSHLQRLAWAHGRAAAPPSPLRPAMLLAPMPGEQHTFGLNMLLEEMRARGVEPVALPCPTREALVSAAASGRFAVIGLSVGSDQRLAEIPMLAQALRRAAPSRIRLILGGPIVDDATAVAGIDEILGGELAVDRLCALASQETFDRAAAA